MDISFGFGIENSKKIHLIKCVDCRKLIGVYDGDKPKINLRIRGTICDHYLQRRNATIPESVESFAR